MSKFETFTEYRGLMFSIAYRMVGSVADAEDIVQEAFVRWQAADAVKSPKAYLCQIVTRLAVDHLRRVKSRREDYTGPWLPEPVLTPVAEENAQLAESLSMAVLLLLERLNPNERAAYVLREVFDVEYAEIAETLGANEATCRQWVSRAKDHLAGRKSRFAADGSRHRVVLEQFSQAFETGDLDGLMSVLAEDVVTYSDGGGKRRAAINPIHGANRNARFYIGIGPKSPPGSYVELALLNYEPAILGLVRTSGSPELHSVTVFDITREKIQTIFVIVNPDKLQRIATTLGMRVHEG